MKHIFMNMAVVGLFSLGLASCSDELNISSIDPQSKTTYDDMELLAKQYATLGLTGQAGPAGKSDISADEGETGFYRTTFNLQELCSDECIWAWQNDNDIPALTNISWTAASDRVNWAYQRLAYDVSGMPYAGTSDMWSCNFARKALATRFLDIENNNKAKKLAEMLSETKKYKEAYEAYTNGKTFADAGAASDPTKMTEAEVIAADEALGGSTKNIIKLAQDDRALLYAGVGGGFRTLTTDQISGFTNGLSVVKWQNIRSDNSTPSDGKFSDTDIPLFRLAEIYLTRAEAKYRLNGTQDLEDINELRNRAHATPVSAVNLAVLLNEWGKEFYMEGRRRSDLVRFEKFAGNKYIWDFKGGVSKGTSVDKHFNVYPIPSKDTSNNPNMHQNPKYE